MPQAAWAMKRLVFLLTACLSIQAAPAADLLAVYQRALQNDPQLREAEANRLAALEAKPQAVAALLPQLNGSAQASRQRDVGPDNTVESVSLGPGTPPIIETVPFDGTTTTTNHVYRVDLKQNLFSWQNWVALKSADAQVASNPYSRSTRKTDRPWEARRSAAKSRSCSETIRQRPGSISWFTCPKMLSRTTACRFSWD